MSVHLTCHSSIHLPSSSTLCPPWDSGRPPPPRPVPRTLPNPAMYCSHPLPLASSFLLLETPFPSVSGTVPFLVFYPDGFCGDPWLPLSSVLRRGPAPGLMPGPVSPSLWAVRALTSPIIIFLRGNICEVAPAFDRTQLPIVLWKYICFFLSSHQSLDLGDVSAESAARMAPLTDVKQPWLGLGSARCSLMGPVWLPSPFPPAPCPHGRASWTKDMINLAEPYNSKLLTFL